MILSCEECGAEISSRPCTKCGNPVPDWAKFCPHCGLELVVKRTHSQVKSKRQLCPDESCIGIIGPDGLCTDCGKRP